MRNWYAKYEMYRMRNWIFFQQMEETNAPNADQAYLKALRLIVDVAVAAAKPSFLSKSRNIFSHYKFHKI